MSTNKLIVKGSFLSAVVLFIQIAIAFFMMPFIIRIIGEHDYGIWILISALVGYYGMLDFGISGSVLRFVSREIGAGRGENAKYYINSAFFVLCGFGLIIIVISFVITLCLPFFVKDIESISLFRFAIIVLGLTIGLSFPLRVFDGVLSAHLRFDIKRYIEFSEIVLRTIALIIVLKMGCGLFGIVVITALAGIGELIVKTFSCVKIDHQFSFGIKFFSFLKIKEMGEFAIVSFLNSITNILTSRLDPYVVALVSNVNTVAYYGVALTLTNYFGDFFKTTQGVLFPLFSQKEGNRDFSGMERWLTFGSKLSTILASFMGGMVILYGREFLDCWLGSNFRVSYLYTAILISPMIFAYGLFPAVFILNSTGKHRLATILDAMRGGINLCLSLILGYKIGAAGVALGTAIPCTIFDIILKPYFACKTIEASPFRLFGQLIGVVLKVSILMAPIWYLFGRDLKASYISLSLIISVHFLFMFSLGFFTLLRKEERYYAILCFNIFFKRKSVCQRSL